MRHEELTFVGTCDIAGLVRGKGFPSSELETRGKTGIGWTHSNLMQTCFGPIFDTPFGTGGDLMIVPDTSAEVRVDFGEGAPGAEVEHFFLGDICNTDGSPWECCPRDFLRRAIAALKEVSGLELIAAFEQEFVYTGIEDRPGHAYSLNAFRRQGPFGESFVAALRAAGVTPNSFLTEYGPRQFEFTVAPQPALKAADQAVIAREMARAVAFRLGHRAIFSPMPVADGVGNGVHIHFSLNDEAGRRQTYDPSGPLGSEWARPAFCRWRARASRGDLRHHRAVARVLFAAHAQSLGADQYRYREAGQGCRASRVPRVRGGQEEGNRAGVQSRVPRLRWGGQSVYGARRSDLRRCRRHRAEALVAASAAHPLPLCRIRSARRSIPWRRARRSRVGSDRCSARPISVTSAPSSLM